MERGLFIAASGMLAAQIRQDVIANNLANATNPGFKGGGTLAGRLRRPAAARTPRPVRRSGRSAPARSITSIKPNLDQHRGSAGRRTRSTGDRRNGWFAVQTPQGVRYTRNGAFTTDAQGFLITAQGDKVLGKDGQPLDLSGGGRISIARTGESTSGPAGRLRRRRRARSGLAPQGGRQLPHGHGPGERQGRRRGPGRARDVERQHVSEMVELIENMREFEADQKVIRALDDTLGGAVNQVGRV